MKKYEITEENAMKKYEITEEMVSELRERLLKRVFEKTDGLVADEHYNSFRILKRIEVHQGIYVINLYPFETKSMSFETLIYGSKNSVLRDTIYFKNYLLSS